MAACRLRLTLPAACFQMGGRWRGQLGRKRHIGNDIVAIVFADEGKPLSFSPTSIVSHFLRTLGRPQTTPPGGRHHSRCARMHLPTPRARPDMYIVVQREGTVDGRPVYR